MAQVSAPARAQRVILLATARSYRSRPFLEAAGRLGLDVVLGKDVPLPMLKKMEAGLPLDYRDLSRSTEAIVRYAERHPVGAIVGLDDSGSELAARASTLLGLPCNSPEAAAAARSKHLMRQKFAHAGVPSPRFWLYHLDDNPHELADRLPYPCVLKPTTLAGSRGVMRANHPAEFVERFERLRRILMPEVCDEVLVEDYIPGVELALEGLLSRGRLTVLALFDKPDPLEGPFFEETIYVTPSCLSAETQQAIFDTTAEAAAALGLIEGPIHAELRLNQQGPWLVEVAARSIGGLCSRVLRFGTDVPLEEVVLRQAFGMEIGSLKNDGSARGVMMIPIPQAGVLKNVAGCEQAQATPLIEGLEITARLNYPLIPLPEGDSYLGFIFGRGETSAGVEAALREAHRKLQFEIVPEIPLA